jgi:hypothetical protein
MRIANTSFRSARLDASASSLSVIPKLIAVGLTLPAALTGFSVVADEPDDATRDTERLAAAESVEQVALSSLVSFDAASVLSEADLTEQRAMAKVEIDKITVNETEQNGTVAGNVAVGNTGGNSIADHAFEGASGTIMSIQNTGNNVLIQNSTTINVSVE